jgi:hypothetical protein
VHVAETGDVGACPPDRADRPPEIGTEASEPAHVEGRSVRAACPFLGAPVGLDVVRCPRRVWRNTGPSVIVHSVTTSLPHFSDMLKLDRALEHLKTFEERRDWWFATGEAYAITEKRYPDTGQYVRWIEPKRLPPSLSLIVGDIFHNLRSALDHLVYELAEAHSGTPLPPVIEKGLQFIVSGKEPPSAETIQYRLGGIHPSARTLILELQPHHRGDAFDTDPLWIVNELDRVDKHRQLTVTMMGIWHTSIPPGTASNIVLANMYHGPLAPDIRTEVIHVHEVREPSVEVEFDQTLDIALPDDAPAGARRNVRELVFDCRNYIYNSVMLPLSPFLD